MLAGCGDGEVLEVAANSVGAVSVCGGYATWNGPAHSTRAAGCEEKDEDAWKRGGDSCAPLYCCLVDFGWPWTRREVLGDEEQEREGGLREAMADGVDGGRREETRTWEGFIEEERGGRFVAEGEKERMRR